MDDIDRGSVVVNAIFTIIDTRHQTVFPDQTFNLNYLPSVCLGRRKLMLLYGARQAKLKKLAGFVVALR
ncbi:hypothetical protein OK016_11940 [Vibrio chagasii]|nr:hypothetical protein [Vibrio chagasii]